MKPLVVNFEENPFHHAIIDDFFPTEVALKLEEQFPPYHDPSWYYYHNALEDKKTLNFWHMFQQETYCAFHSLCKLDINGAVADFGLHGGGWHIHANGGNCNPHRDYEVHPKLKLQRKYNLIVYLSSNYQESYGGELGLWEGNEKEPTKLIKTIWPKFNRAVLFDVSGVSWHGLVSKVNCPDNVYRKSIAIYYLADGAGTREKALFAPREDQKGDKSVEELIQRRLRGEYK